MGIDMRDWERFRACFADEIEVDFRSLQGGGPRRVSADAWVSDVKGIVGFEATQHSLTNFVVTLRGDEATAVAAMQAVHYLPNTDGDSTFTIGGYYTHELARSGAGWKIRKTRLTVTWTAGNRHVMVLGRERAAAGLAGGKRE
jgi:3-phenylpropionate/cinnamic acid dioxygenase small subunit